MKLKGILIFTTLNNMVSYLYQLKSHKSLLQSTQLKTLEYQQNHTINYHERRNFIRRGILLLN